MKLLKTPFYIVILLSTILLGACGGENDAEPTAVNSEIADAVEMELSEAGDMLAVLLEEQGELPEDADDMLHYFVVTRIINNSEQDIFIQGDGRLEYFDDSEWIPLSTNIVFFYSIDGQLIPPNEIDFISGLFNMPEDVGVDGLFRVIQRVNTTATFEDDGQHDLILEFQLDIDG